MSTERSEYFAARWGRSLRFFTGAGLLIFAAIPVTVLAAAGIVVALIVAGVVWALVIATIFFAVRGYLVTPTHLVIVRPGWQLRFALEDIISCKADPKAMTGSTRLFGIGGLFCFVGLFQNRRLGKYRAYATDPDNSVVLVLKDRCIVVTPESPVRFVEAVVTAKNAVAR